MASGWRNEAALKKHPNNLDAAMGALLDSDNVETSGPVSTVLD